MDIRLHAITWALSLVGVAAAQQQARGPANTVPAGLAAARARAAVHNKRVLVALPTPGQDLAHMVQRDRKVSRTFRYEFEVFQAGAELYLPLQRPALLVQDASGRILSHLQAPDFLADGALKGAELLAQVEPLFCAPVDAEQKLAAAMTEAKKSGRNILIRFDAPW